MGKSFISFYGARGPACLININIIRPSWDCSNGRRVARVTRAVRIVEVFSVTRRNVEGEVWFGMEERVPGKSDQGLSIAIPVVRPLES